MGEKTGLLLSSSQADIRYADISGPASSVAVRGEAGAREVLFAYCRFSGSQLSVHLSEVTNAVVLFSGLTNLLAADSESVFVCENTVSGELSFSGNRYLLINRNAVEEGRIRDQDNEYGSGDTIRDLDARAEAGANEDLLPQVNKELFVGRPRAEYVRTEDREAEQTLAYQMMYGEERNGVIAVSHSSGHKLEARHTTPTSVQGSLRLANGMKLSFDAVRNTSGRVSDDCAPL